jgi:hypothetical protein
LKGTGALDFLLPDEQKENTMNSVNQEKESYKLGEAFKLKKMDEEDLESDSSFKKTVDIQKLKFDIKPIIYQPPDEDS